MQCEDVEVEMPVAPKMSELDAALHELGALSPPRTSSRQEYLREIQNKQVLNMLSVNRRYVSNVSIGFRVRPVTPYVRYRPYELPRREERHRTKSENNDDADGGTANVALERTVETGRVADDVSQLKKAKSLESIILENNKEIDLNGYFKLPEVESMSDCIGKLKVDE